MSITEEEAAIAMRLDEEARRMREETVRKIRADLASGAFPYVCLHEPRIHRADGGCWPWAESVTESMIRNGFVLELYTEEQASELVESGAKKRCRKCYVAASRRDASAEGYVYVVGAAGSSVVKIGYSSNVTKRLRALQNASPAPLSVMWTTRGDMSTERRLHREFDKCRIRGEWFDFGGADPVAEIRGAAARLGLEGAAQ